MEHVDNKKDYKDRDLTYEINLKINTINKTRTNRILASKRLYKYANHWEFIFLLMNVTAVSLLIISLIDQVSNSRSLSLIISSIFSLYTILVQNYISKMNYNERALKFHYHQLELERRILELKKLLLKKEDDENKINEDYQTVMEKYFLSLSGYENHEDIDNSRRTDKTRKDFSLDNVWLILQFPILFLMLIIYGVAICLN